ncbi:hypothetical protein R2A130_2298 [Ahrensia sp. R2A130]|nr:hypothetical protein R2A130_2298 [Ahrensia sp. R2A130]
MVTAPTGTAKVMAAATAIARAIKAKFQFCFDISGRPLKHPPMITKAVKTKTTL